MKVIAIDIDNVLNDFDATLANTDFVYNDSYGVSQHDFVQYIAAVKRNEPIATKFLTTKYSDFRSRIHGQCYLLAQARFDGVEFMQWLRKNRWKIIICTKRNLRLAGDPTKQWLANNRIPYDYLVMALNKIVFCKLWQVPYLVDDDPLNVAYGQRYGIQVFYPSAPADSRNNRTQQAYCARGFSNFEEIKPWIAE